MNNKITKFLYLLILTLAFKQAVATDTLTIVKTGHINSDGIFKLVYVPVLVPPGIAEIQVKETYNESEHPNKNVLNMGVYDQRGYQLGNPKGFRGWSGGAKKSFFINAGSASTGYIPGSIQAGLWNILIYPSTIIPEGIDWKIEVKLIQGKPLKPFVVSRAQTSVNNKPGWYRGDLHMHTLHSDGKRTLEELVAEAKAKKLDYIISTEHNTISANQNWGKYNSKDLLIINGEEVTTTEFGHWNAIGLNTDTYIDWRYTPQDSLITPMINRVHQDKGLAIINHPFFNIKQINGFGFDVNLFDGIEIWNGTWNYFNFNFNELALKWWDDQLRLGKKKIGIGASDTHQASGSRNNLGDPQTVVFARSLSKKDIIDGIRNGRVYVAAQSNIDVNFSIGAEGRIVGLGDTVYIKHGQQLNILLKIKNCINDTVTLHSNNGLVRSDVINLNDDILHLKINGDGIKYLRIEIRNPNGEMSALTNPIWVYLKQ